MTSRSNRLSAIAIIIGLVNAILLVWIGFFPPSGGVEGQPATKDDMGIATLFERASPSVVYITTLKEVRGRFGMNAHHVPGGTGTGFLWSAEGHVVTNYHVIAGASDAVVSLSDGSQRVATLVGAAPDHDLAVLKIAPEGKVLTPIVVGASKSLRPGQFAMAIGNPFGLDHSLTTGVISALDREIDAANGRKIFGVIQTDAAINPGNSGGPLLDAEGRLIGVNTAIQSPSGAYAGIGFAVPVDTVSRVVPQLIRYGSAPRPGLGLTIATAATARHFGEAGLVITRVAGGSAAQQAGLVGLRKDRRGRIHLGDVIVGADGAAISGPTGLMKALDPLSVGDFITLEVRRDGALRTVRLRLQAVN